MDFNAVELAHELSRLQDEELLRRCEQGFTEQALPLVGAELARRGLSWPAPEPAVQSVPYAGDWAVLTRHLTPTEAHMLKSFLASVDIPASVGDVHLTQANPLMSLATGGACVRVPAQFLSEAQDLLTAFRRGDFELRDDFEAGT